MQTFATRTPLLFAVALLVAAIGLIGPSTSAHAGVNSWETMPKVGDCSSADNNYNGVVVGAQLYLWVEGNYEQPNSGPVPDYPVNGPYVDGTAGAITKGAIRWFQKRHGLTQDGCLGPKGWSKMRSKLYRDGSQVCKGETVSRYYRSTSAAGFKVEYKYHPSGANASQSWSAWTTYDGSRAVRTTSWVDKNYGYKMSTWQQEFKC